MEKDSTVSPAIIAVASHPESAVPMGFSAVARPAPV